MRRLLPLSVAVLLGACGDPASPVGPEPASPEFAGSGACATCHEAEYDAWQGSHHALAMQAATADTVLGDFDDATFDYFGETTVFRRRDGRFVIETLDGHGERREFEVTDAFGVYPLQQYLVDSPGGRKQALPFAWDTRPEADGGQRWYHLYPDEYIGPDDELHWTGHYLNWNFMCAECHSTQLETGYDFDTDTFDTTYAEISVGCEACHGPSSVHIEQAESGVWGNGFGLVVDLDDARGAAWIVDPETGIAARSKPTEDPARQPEACGRCHARRGVVAPVYEYGRPLADTHSPALLDEPLYFADGQIFDEVYVYGSFIQSRMHAAGVVCSDCHDPHSANLLTGPAPSDVCSTCHLPAGFATTAHSGHDPGTVSCVDCHMPSRTYMGVDDRRDHSFRVPRPDLAAAINTPLACDDCHAGDERTLAAAGEDKSRPHFGEFIAAGRAGEGNDVLVAGLTDYDFPPIARATILSLMQPPFSPRDIETLRVAFEDEDPLVRIGALRALERAPPEIRLAAGASSLADPARSVRIEAAGVFADVRDLLPLEEARAFGRASDEYVETYRMLASAPGALANLATFSEAGGDPVAASEYFRRAVAAAPRNAALRHALGLSHVRTGRTDAALEELRLATELEPSEPRFVYVYGVALNSLGQHEEAVAVLARAYASHDRNFDIGWALASILRDAGDVDAATTIARELAAAYPGNANVTALLQSLERDSQQTNR